MFRSKFFTGIFLQKPPHSTWEAKKLEKMLFAFAIFGFRKGDIMKTFGVYIIRNLLEHPIGDYENTWESSFWKFSVFEENWGYHENVGFWRLKKCSRKKYISKLFTAWVFERFKEISIFLSNFFCLTVLKNTFEPWKVFPENRYLKDSENWKNGICLSGICQKRWTFSVSLWRKN